MNAMENSVDPNSRQVHTSCVLSRAIRTSRVISNLRHHGLKAVNPQSIFKLCFFIVAILFSGHVCLAQGSSGLTPESPEVRKLIDLACKRLDRDVKDSRLGAKCLVGLALYKADKKGHKNIKAAIEACRKRSGDILSLDVYSHGIALIFLCEVGAESELSLARAYLGKMYQRQKAHGGWGYSHKSTGDTSQTQYMALALWEAHVHGIELQKKSAHGMIDWLIKTQGPKGEWGYQGNVRPTDKPVEQDEEVSNTMAAAALSSLMIGADLFDLLQGGESQQMVKKTKKLPSGVQLAEKDDKGVKAKKLNPSDFDWEPAFGAIRAGNKWFDKNYKPADSRTSYPVYYLYSLERYLSFRELYESKVDPSPKWYNQGYDYLKKTQKSPGTWVARCGEEADTALATLFLLRSTQKSIRRRIGLGKMLSGRGLPTDFANARLRGGKVIGETKKVGLGEFLSLVDGQQSDALDQLANDPNGLVSGDLTDADVDRLRRLLRGGEPDARVVAARILGHTSELDSVPSLLYAFTDPDRRVVIAARDGLRLISRRPRGFGLTDNYNDEQRYYVLNQWKQWYLNLQPDAVLDID